jgi:hypothetical protein
LSGDISEPADSEGLQKFPILAFSQNCTFVVGFSFWLALKEQPVRMKLVDIVILSLAVVFVIIGIYEIMTRGISFAYWSIMLSTGLFFLLVYRRKR